MAANAMARLGFSRFAGVRQSCAVPSRRGRCNRDHVRTVGDFGIHCERRVLRIHDRRVRPRNDRAGLVGQMTRNPHAPAVDRVGQLIQTAEPTPCHRGVNLLRQPVAAGSSP